MGDGTGVMELDTTPDARGAEEEEADADLLEEDSESSRGRKYDGVM